MFENFVQLLKDNQFLVAGLGLSGAGLLTFWLRDVPVRIFSFLKRQLTTDLTIQNYDLVFYDILKWIRVKNQTKNFRTLKLNNGKWGSDERAMTSMGYGYHIISYKNTFLFVNYYKENESISDKVKESIIITKLGRSRKLFTSLIRDVEKLNEDITKLKLYKMDNGWCFSNRFRKRNINSTFIDKKKKLLIFNNIDNFIKREKWYISKGIPYQYGVLLHGKPGTGKTSLIKAIATKYNYNIYYLAPGKIHEIENALTTCSEKAIVVIEDIDTNTVVHKRKKNKQKNLLDDLSVINLSDILNALDGLNNIHGRLLICTTNHIDHLDKALIRPGRFDLLVEVGFANKEILKQFFNYYFPKTKIKLNGILIRPNVSVADLQNMILLGYDYKKILGEISITR